MDPKALKVQFVSGHGGTSFLETLGVTSVILSAAFCHRTLLHILPDAILKHSVLSIVVEFLVLVLPMLIALTQTELAIPLHLSCLIAGFIMWWKPSDRPSVHCSDAGRLQCLEGYRSMLMLTTCFSILAVDFHVFPRRFAKTHLFGVSVMDTGTGCFVFSNALVYSFRSSKPGVVAWRRTFTSFLPLLLLGLLRLAFIKGADYHEVVEEYGVHWNFFFTLAGLPLLVLLYNCLPLIQKLHPIIAGLCTLAVYQFVLSAFGVTEYVMNSDRSNLLAANKEGILSLFGYFSLYLIGIGLGRLLFSKPLTHGRRIWDRLLQPQVGLIWGALLLASIATKACDSLVQPVSRRLCNAGYVMFMVVYNLWFVGGFLMIDIIQPLSKEDAKWQRILPAVNSNQLVCFLCGNVMTGLVNMSMNTVAATDGIAKLVLLLYMALLITVMVLLHMHNIRIKM